MSNTQFFIDQLISKYGHRHAENAIIEITDRSAIIIAASNEERVGTKSMTAQYAMDTKQPMMIGDPTASDGAANSHMRYYIPVHHENEPWGVVIVRGNLEVIRTCAEAIEDALTAFLAFDSSQKLEYSSLSRRLIRKLIAGNPDREDRDFILQNISNSHSGDDNIYAIILISIERSGMNYFNIHLDLGYQAPQADLQVSILNAIGENAHITQRDIFSFIDESHIVILKSFLKIEDISKIYIALDTISQSLLEDIHAMTTSKLHLCYGNTYSSIFDAYKSYQDACEIMEMSLIVNPEGAVYTLESIFFENVCSTLHPQIINKMILPYLEKMADQSNALQKDLLFVAEKYVDNCMRISQTASDLYLHRNTIDLKIERLRKLTGLDPAKNYRDSFLVKMMAVYVHQMEKEFAIQAQE